MAAVSPVVGTILILAIVVFAMAGILAWGVPAIQALQDHAEYQSVQTQLLELNQDVRNLRDPQSTRVSLVSIVAGDLQFGSGDRWVISGMTDSAYQDYRIDGYQDDDAFLTITGAPAGAATLEKVLGGQFTLLDSNPACPIGTCTLSTNALPPGGNIATDTLRLQYKVGSIVQAETWILDAGRFTYTQAETNNQNVLEMGASIIVQNTGTYMRQSPTVKEPRFDTAPQDTDFFVRVVQMTGTEGQSGRGEFSVLVNLVDNYGVSRGRPLLEDADFVRFQIEGDLEEAFCNHFLFTDDDYRYDGTSTDCAGGDANVLYAPTQEFTYQMGQAVVNGFVSTA